MRSRAIRRKWASAITSIFTLAFLAGVTGPAAAFVPTIVLDPATDTNAVGTEHMVTATVEDEGTPIEGASVHFDVDPVGAPVPTSGDDVTDAAGEATFTFTNTEAVSNIITACIEIVVDQTCGVGETSTTATKTWEEPVATTIDLTPAMDTNPVDTTHAMTATVLDQFGVAFEGADVHFDVAGDGTPVPATGDGTTNASGEAAFAFSNDTAGTNTITACIDENANQICDIDPVEVADTATKTWEVRTPTTIDVAPENAINVPGTDHTVTATVLDQFDDPVAGEQVRIAVTGTGSPSPTALTANTDANGEVDFTFSNPVEAVNTITACFGPVETEVCDTATKSWEEPAPTTISLAPATDTNPVDTDHTVTATVLDQFGDPSVGVDVHFDVTGDGVPAPTTGDDVTDAAGEATFTFTNTEAATNSITGCIDENANQTCDVGETADTGEKVWEARVATAISLDPATATNEVDTNHTVTATVVDQVGDPVPGVTVLFDVSAEGTPVPTTGSAITDVNGEGTFTFTNSTADVTNTITACMDTDPENAVCDVGEETATATKAWVPEAPVPTTISLAPATDTNPVDTDHTVTATVLDQFGEPFAGADIHFDVDAAGAPDPTTGDDVTDAAGEATFTFTNTEAATNSITGCIDENANQTCDVGETADTAEKVWEARVATAISLDPATATNEVDTNHTVTATVVDQVGDPVQGVAVLFDVDSEGTPSPMSGSGITNASGIVTFTFTNSTAGVTNTVTACMDTSPQNAVCDVDEETDTATKSWVAAETCPGFEADPRNQIVGTPGDDVLEGTPGDDIICGLGGDDTLAGLGGDDLILGGPGNDTLIGGPGDDILRGHAGRDVIRGGSGSDLLIGGGNRDTLQGGGDDDILRGNAGNDILRGGGGNDDLRGGGGRDAIRGASGDDTLRGGGGNDDLRAGGGDDRVFGGSGDDVLRGGAGNDLLNGGAGTDSCAGGPGSDVLVNCES